MVARLAPLPIQQTDDLVTAVGPFERARGSNVTVVGCFREYIFPLATTPREVMIAQASVRECTLTGASAWSPLGGSAAATALRSDAMSGCAQSGYGRMAMNAPRPCEKVVTWPDGRSYT
jgi:hypothetical protein